MRVVEAGSYKWAMVRYLRNDPISLPVCAMMREELVEAKDKV